MAAPPFAWTSLRGQTEKRIDIYALLFLTGLAAIVRLAFLNQPIRYDEAYNFIAFTSRSLKTIISDYHFPNNHIFHTLLMHLSYVALGAQPWALRLPALAAGILMVPAAYLAAALTYERRTALLSAGLIASSSILIEYSTNARGYTLVGLMALLIYTLAICSKGKGQPAAWAMLVCLSALGFYTIPVMLYPFGAVMLWLALSGLVRDTGHDSRRRFLIYTLSAGASTAFLTILLYLPVLRASGMRAVTGNPFVQPLVWGAFLENNLNELRLTWIAWMRDLPLAARLLLGTGFILALIFHQRLSRQKIPFILVAVMWSIFLLVLQRVAPWPRVWLFWLPFYFISAAAGMLGLAQAVIHLGRIKPPRLLEGTYLTAVLAAACLLSLKVLSTRSPALSYDTGVFPEAEQAALFLSGYLQPGDTVLASLPADYPLRYYFQLHQIPKKYFYDASDRDGFRRALIVVNGIYRQTAGTVIQQHGLGDLLDERGAVAVYRDGQAIIYEMER